MVKKLRSLWDEHPWLSFAAILLFATVASAGLKNRHLHQFPAPAFAQKLSVTLIEDTTASKDRAWRRQWPYDIVFEGMDVLVRQMTGTITQATLVLYNNDQIVLRTAVDLYGGALASAGTIYHIGPEQLASLDPTWLSGEDMSCGIFIAGTNTPTLTDITTALTVRSKLGTEAQ